MPLEAGNLRMKGKLRIRVIRYNAPWRRFQRWLHSKLQ